MIHPSKNIRIGKNFEPANFVNCSFGFYCNASGFTLCVSEKLKELEKLGPKKGVISQSVKDVVQSLVDDDLVSKDKIGTSRRNVYKKLEADLQTSKKQHVELVEQFSSQGNSYCGTWHQGCCRFRIW